MSCRTQREDSSQGPSTSNVPHAQTDTVGRLHGDELRPLAVRAVGDLDYSFPSSLLTIDPRNLVLGQIDMRSGTIRRQVSVVYCWDFEVLAEILRRSRVGMETYTMRPGWWRAGTGSNARTAKFGTFR